tara:strand:- start:640 stop:1452 length:813 start_codon:yes stop_codon:yes gene_type:complete
MKRVMKKMGIIQEKKTIPTIHECVYYLTQNKLNKNILPKELKRSYSTELEILQLAYQTDNNGGNELDNSLWTPLHRYIVFRKNIIADDDLFFQKLLSITSKENLFKKIPFRIITYLLIKNYEAHPLLLNKLLNAYINDLDMSFFFNSLDYKYKYEVLIYSILLPRLEFAKYIDPIYGISCVHKLLWKFQEFPYANHLLDLLIDIFPSSLSMKCEPRFSSLPFTMALQQHANEELLLKMIDYYPQACCEIDLHENTTLHVLIKNLTIYKSV